MPLTVQIEANSIAALNGLESGDKIHRINGREINDQIDFSYNSAEEFLEIELEKPDGKSYYTIIEREYNKELGISVIPPAIEQCDNRCVFCFIHQQPKKLRRSLYVMDDDYRFSFSDGNFITLTNLQPHEWRRIYQLKLSPLYISVHATEGSIRKKMLRHPKAGEILKQLKKLARHNIHYHTQIVLCRNYNDQEHLDKTILDLEKLIPHMEGIAVVPSGLTRFRKHLPNLLSWDQKAAGRTLKQLQKWQHYFREKYGRSVVYPSDEFYFIAKQKAPPAKFYDGFYYTEDGVGTSRYFYHIFNKHKRKLPVSLEKSRKVTVICGEIAEMFLQEAVGRMNQIDNLQMKLISIKNNFFGEGINVTGLLTATDIIEQLKNRSLGDELILPAVTLKKDEKIFLDDYTVPQLSTALNTPVRVSPMGAEHFIDAALGLGREA